MDDVKYMYEYNDFYCYARIFVKKERKVDTLICFSGEWKSRNLTKL